MALRSKSPLVHHHVMRVAHSKLRQDCSSDVTRYVRIVEAGASTPRAFRQRYNATCNATLYVRIVEASALQLLLDQELSDKDTTQLATQLSTYE